MPTKAQKLALIKKNPDLAILNMLEDMELKVEKQTESVIDKKMAEMQTELSRKVEEGNRIFNTLKKIKGEKGDDGKTGATGATGPQGQSIQGPKGDDAKMKGEKGEMGERGFEGPQGESVQGPPGTLGENGKDGRDGLPGRNGENGKDGAETFTDEMREKLKSFPIFSEVKRLITETAQTLTRREAARGGGKGGGGMGNPQHESFSISSATTSVTTKFPIAANGTAIFPFTYQGQVLILNVHYTVGTDKKTLTFVPAVQAQLNNNSTVAITYVRGS